MLHHGSEDYDPSLSFCTVPGFAEDLGFWKCRGTRRFMHNDAPDAATLDWVDWRWIFMQVINVFFSQRQLLCAGAWAEKHVADNTQTCGWAARVPQTGERKETSFVWDSLRLVGPGSACWNRLCSSRHMAVTASNSRVRSNSVPFGER